MIVTNQDKLEKVVKNIYPRIRIVRAARVNTSNASAIAQGKIDGKNIEIRPSIGPLSSKLEIT